MHDAAIAKLTTAIGQAWECGQLSPHGWRERNF